MSRLRVGIDTGRTRSPTSSGLGRTPASSVHKLRTTPADPSRAILTGLGQLPAARRSADVVHGSTVATNAVLERKGARVALVATAGLRGRPAHRPADPRRALQHLRAAAAAARRSRADVRRRRAARCGGRRRHADLTDAEIRTGGGRARGQRGGRRRGLPAALVRESRARAAWLAARLRDRGWSVCRRTKSCPSTASSSGGARRSSTRTSRR